MEQQQALSQHKRNDGGAGVFNRRYRQQQGSNNNKNNNNSKNDRRGGRREEEQELPDHQDQGDQGDGDNHVISDGDTNSQGGGSNGRGGGGCPSGSGGSSSNNSDCSSDAGGGANDDSNDNDNNAKMAGKSGGGEQQGAVTASSNNNNNGGSSSAGTKPASAGSRKAGKRDRSNLRKGKWTVSSFFSFVCLQREAERPLLKLLADGCAHPLFSFFLPYSPSVRSLSLSFDSQGRRGGVYVEDHPLLLHGSADIARGLDAPRLLGGEAELRPDEDHEEVRRGVVPGTAGVPVQAEAPAERHRDPASEGRARPARAEVPTPRRGGTSGVAPPEPEQLGGVAVVRHVGRPGGYRGGGRRCQRTPAAFAAAAAAAASTQPTTGSVFVCKYAPVPAHESCLGVIVRRRGRCSGDGGGPNPCRFDRGATAPAAAAATAAGCDNHELLRCISPATDTFAFRNYDVVYDKRTSAGPAAAATTAGSAAISGTTS